MKKAQLVFVFILWGTLKGYAPDHKKEIEVKKETHYWTDNMNSKFMIRYKKGPI